MARILHISNDYSSSTVYKNLVKEIDNLGVEQVVYTPIRGTELVGKNSIEFTNKKSETIYSSILNRHIDRVLYPFKIFKILKDIQKKVDFSQIDFIHAHTWYSDGGVAYFLSKKYNIPFIVAIRNTDLNLFQKKLVYLRPFGRAVLKKAKNIVLISGSYLPRVLSQQSLQGSLSLIKSKIRVMPNGVDPYWINNAVERVISDVQSENINLIYVGRLTAGKNVPLAQDAVIQLNQKSNYKIHLHIVGGGGAEHEKVVANAKKHAKFFTYHGKVYDKVKLTDLYRSSDIFVMPSSHETFGLVYVEAMLQGLPILYTANEGIDGFYSDDIGEKVHKPTVDEISEKLITMMENLSSYNVPTAELKKNHDWAEIAKQYLSMYKAPL